MATEFVDKQWRIPNSWNVDESNQGKISNYSMKFDGTNDFVDISVASSDVVPSSQSSWTYSAWLYLDSGSSQTLLERGAAYPGSGMLVRTFSTTGKIQVFVSGTVLPLSSNAIPTGVWSHFALVYDISTNELTYCINNSFQTVSMPSGWAISGTLFNIGKRQNNTGYWLGKMDQVSVFDYALPQTGTNSIATLYGNNSAGYFQIGNPMALTPNPVAFYPLGDQDAQQTVDSTDWRIPNQVAAGGDVFQSVPLRTANAVPTDTITSNINYTGTPGLPDSFTVSFWMKDSVFGNGSVFFDHDASTYTASTPKGAFVYFATGRVLIYLKSNYWRYYNLPAGVVLTDNEWRNIVVYMDPASNLLGKVWIDGTPLSPSTSNNGAPSSDFTAGFKFYLNNFGSNVMYFKDYEIDNAGATLLYNNGAPLLDTSTLAQAPDHWWKLNASDTFDIATSTWTIKDHVGSENGTSVNMDASNLVSSELPNTGGRQGYSPWAIDLDGIDDNFTIDNSSEDLNVEYLTASVWFKPDVAKFASLIANRYFNSGFMSWAVQTFADGRIRYIQRNPGVGANFYTTDTYNVGEWNHVAVTYSSGLAKIYLNGGTPVSQITALIPIQYDTGFVGDNVTIGSAPAGGSTSAPTGPTQLFDGQLSNVAVWNSSLSSSQIATIYNNGIPGDISSLNPLAWWELGVMTGFNSSTGIWTAISNTKTNYAAVSKDNMTEGDLVNGPGYSTNATGTSTLVLEKQAPYSFNNALSENMAISNRDDSQASDSYPLIVELDLTGETSSYNFTTPALQASTTFPFTMDWGDGTVETITSTSQFTSLRLVHTYDTDAYPRPVIQIGKSTDVGQVKSFSTGNGGSKLQLSDLKQFGQSTFTQFNILNAQKMLITAKDNLKTNTVNLGSLLYNAYKANPSTINNWDISSVNTASTLFYSAQSFNQDLNNWDTSSTRAGQSDPGILSLANNTFAFNYKFNGDVTNWYTTRSTTMASMFYFCRVFNKDVSTKYISAANSPTGSAYVAWDTQNITRFSSTFQGAKSFNQDISNWNTSKATTMRIMFGDATPFNQDVSTKQVTVNGVTYTAWDVSKVIDMFGMFGYTVFNNTLDNWELNANLTTMQQMFISNQTISDENFSDNWAIFANSVKDNNSASGGAATNLPSGVNATAQNNSALIKVNRSAPTSSGGVQHFTTISRALSYLTSDVEINFYEEEEDAVQLYTADFLDTVNSSYPTKLVGVTVTDFTFEWSGSVWEFKKSGVTRDTDTGGATLQEGPENGTWNILTVVTANANWNFQNTSPVYTT